jgi:hypothetical protein
MDLYGERLVERQDFKQEGNLPALQAKPLDYRFSDEFWMGSEMR